MWFFLLACTLSEPGPAPTGTPAADALPEVETVAEQAAEIATLANELTALTDESRRQVASGNSTQAEEVAKMQALMDEIEAKNAVLQETVRAIEIGAHEAAGDVAWPPEKIEGR